MTSMEANGNAAIGRPNFSGPLSSSVSIDAAPLTPFLDDSIFSLTPGQNSHGGKFESEELLERKLNFSKNKIENAVFTKSSDAKSSDWKNELQRYEDLMPPKLRVGYFDVAILYAETEREQAEKYKEHLENDMEITCGRKMKVVLYDGPEMVALTGALTKQLDHVLERCTQIFMYLTEIFCTEAWMEYASEACLVEAIYNVEKQWCCVPIFNYPRSSTPFKVPLVLNCLKGVNYYQNDQFYRKAVGRLIEDKMHKRLEKEFQHEQEQMLWLVEFKKQQAQRLSEEQIMLMVHAAQLEEMKTSLDQREDAYRKCLNSINRQPSNSQIHPEPGKPIQYFTPPSLNLNHSQNVEQLKLGYKDSKDIVSFSDNMQPLNSPQNLDEEMRNIALSKSGLFRNTTSYPVQEKETRRVEHPHSPIISDAGEVQMKIISSGNPIFGLQREALSHYGSTSKDNSCSSSSISQQDAATSVSSYEKLSDIVSPCASNISDQAVTKQQKFGICDPDKSNPYPGNAASLPPPHRNDPAVELEVSIAHSSIQDNIPKLSMLQSREEKRNYLDGQANSDTSSNVRSRSTTASTIPNLSPFNSLNDKVTSNHFSRSASIQESVPDQIAPNVSSSRVTHAHNEVSVTDNANPPHAINLSLKTSDLDEDAVSLSADAKPEHKQHGSSDSREEKTKIIIKEIHHHHYEHTDQPQKVINIIGAESVQVGTNTMMVNEDDDSEFEELFTEQKSKKKATSREPYTSTESKKSSSDVYGVRDEGMQNPVWLSENTEAGGQDGTGNERTSVSSRASRPIRAESVNSLLHPLDPSYPLCDPVVDRSTSFDDSYSQSLESTTGDKNSLQENTDPAIFYSQKKKKSRLNSTSDNSRCIVS